MRKAPFFVFVLNSHKLSLVVSPGFAKCSLLRMYLCKLYVSNNDEKNGAVGVSTFADYNGC